MSKLALIGSKREELSAGGVKALRRSGLIPVIVYGFNKNYMLTLPYKDFFKEYEKGGLLSQILNIKVGEDVLKVIPKEVQTDPVTDKPIHADFQLVNDSIAIRLAVKIKIINKEMSPGLKRGGILNLVKKNIPLLGLAKDIPQFIEINVSGFEIGRSIHMYDITLPDGITSTEKGNFTILTIAGRVEEEEEENSDNSSESKDQKS